MPERVAIYGGGVAGLTCAHELAERGFEVELFEPTDAFGGKARSFRYPYSQVAGRPGPPGEHGLRFYPGFYVHLDETMSRIPYPGNRRGVLDNLVSTHEGLFARGDHGAIRAFSRCPRHPGELALVARMLHDALDHGLGVRNMLFVGRRLASLAVSCDERLDGELDRLPWSRFLDVDTQAGSPFAAYLGRGWTRTFTALDPDRASTRTLGLTLLRMLAEMWRPGSSVDRVMNGPTSERWIAPWVAHLRSLGVRLRSGTFVTALDVERGRLRGVEVGTRDGRVQRIVADHHVLAIPVEAMSRLLTPRLREAHPELCGIARLETNLMGGVQFFLDRPVALAPGHIHCTDAPWALTAIAQSQHWSSVDLGLCGERPVGEVLSVCLADWRSPGVVTARRRAMDCTVDQLADEVWGQLLEQLPSPQRAELLAARRIGHGVDPRIADPATRARRCEPLFVHTLGCWSDRPSARSGIDGLYLASDYVRSSIDVACMEGANEAARNAVNAVLETSSYAAAGCRVQARAWPRPVQWLRALDAWRFGRAPFPERGRPWAPRLERHDDTTTATSGW